MILNKSRTFQSFDSKRYLHYIRYFQWEEPGKSKMFTCSMHYLQHRENTFPFPQRISMKIGNICKNKIMPHIKRDIALNVTPSCQSHILFVLLFCWEQYVSWLLYSFAFTFSYNFHLHKNKHFPFWNMFSLHFFHFISRMRESDLILLNL